MNLTNYKDLRTSSLKDIPEELWGRGPSLHLPVSGAGRPWLFRGFDRSAIAVLPNTRAVRDFAGDASVISQIADMPEICVLPEELPSIGNDTPEIDTRSAERGEVMLRWARGGAILAATAGALMGPFSVGGDVLNIAVGDEIGRSALIEWLDKKGYERTDIVWTPGQFTWRGGIVDLFDPKDPFPIRIEFFDEEIDTMRYFATDTQRSVKNIKRAELRSLTARKGEGLEGFFPADTHVVFFEPAEIENSADNYLWMRRGAAQGDDSVDIDWGDVRGILARYPRMRVISAIERADISSGLIGLPNFRGRSRDMEAYCVSAAERGASVKVVSEAERYVSWANERGGFFSGIRGAISDGFLDQSAGVLLIGDIELSGVSVSSASGERSAPRDWGERLTPGQWVVHEDYGVAKYVGSEQIETADGPQEYLVLEYAADQRLKIPVMHFHKISRYIGMTGEEPTADNLRGGRWKKSAAKAREQAAEAARYLIDLYAKREVTPGRSFSGDPEQEQQFRETFPYRETSDQLTAIEDVYRDMERSIPMDRLLIGDVGFGKTEVALRASARAVFDGYQVAVMAPTTLLAQQHYETWVSRFEQFGVRVDQLSRFVLPARQKKIIEFAENGTTDIVVGTHRMLGRDVKFKRLGLVIVDEEHRFGVLHKERMKDVYPDVDVLMLSATPIPRSLHMSLTGLRDMSLLQTPPRRRLPVITASSPWSEELVRDAVAREKNRGGQVYYVHNRVKTIDREALMLRRMFPKLLITVAHGQMSERELRDAMDSFAAGKTDILVCTTIVESGLDMPRANTLIVSDSQDLGLAQMHQLRGRVGRRDEQAFAYFFYPAEIRLSHDAAERLDAIAELGEFGAGYELAKRDLEIRGGGELVGTSQSGNAAGVGFERYCELLEEAIRREKGEWKERTVVEVGIPTAIPVDYLPLENLRVALYRRILWMNDTKMLMELKDETRDRFGPLPKTLEFLFAVSAVKILGTERGVSSVTVTKGETVVMFAPDSPLREAKAPLGWYRLNDRMISEGGLDRLPEFVEKMLR